MNYFTTLKHYNTLSEYYKSKYQTKVFKIALNGNFTCPNKDGTVGYGGCTFCSSLGSGDFAGAKDLPIKEQFETIKTMMLKKWPEGYYIAYFQANTNTHGPLSKLKKLFEEVLTLDKKIIGLSIATRPDCLPKEVLDYLNELNKKIPLQVELGLQTIHDKTSILINRLHSLACFDEAVLNLKARNIEVVAHIINGLPLETKAMMVATVRHLNTLPIDGLKIHMLHIMKKTKMGHDYLKKPFSLLSLEEYVETVVLQLRNLRSDIIIHRLTGDAPKKLLIAPKWTLKKFVVANEIDKIMRANNYYQGDLYEETDA